MHALAQGNMIGQPQFDSESCISDFSFSPTLIPFMKSFNTL